MRELCPILCPEPNPTECDGMLVQTSVSAETTIWRGFGSTLSHLVPIVASHCFFVQLELKNPPGFGPCDSTSLPAPRHHGFALGSIPKGLATLVGASVLISRQGRKFMRLPVANVCLRNMKCTLCKKAWKTKDESTCSRKTDARQF
jgi:hypothetical protein